MQQTSCLRLAIIVHETVGAVLYKIHMRVLDAQHAFFAARRPRKDSPHTTDAYRRDLAGITALLAGTSAEHLMVENLTAQALRAAFGAFADVHAKSSVLRAWSTWNQFLTFCVSNGQWPAARWARSPDLKPLPWFRNRCGVKTHPSDS